MLKVHFGTLDQCRRKPAEYFRHVDVVIIGHADPGETPYVHILCKDAATATVVLANVPRTQILSEAVYKPTLLLDNQRLTKRLTDQIRALEVPADQVA